MLNKQRICMYACACVTNIVPTSQHSNMAQASWKLLFLLLRTMQLHHWSFQGPRCCALYTFKLFFWLMNSCNKQDRNTTHSRALLAFATNFRTSSFAFFSSSFFSSFFFFSASFSASFCFFSSAFAASFLSLACFAFGSSVFLALRPLLVFPADFFALASHEARTIIYNRTNSYIPNPKT